VLLWLTILLLYFLSWWVFDLLFCNVKGCTFKSDSFWFDIGLCALNLRDTCNLCLTLHFLSVFNCFCNNLVFLACRYGTFGLLFFYFEFFSLLFILFYLFFKFCQLISGFHERLCFFCWNFSQCLSFFGILFSNFLALSLSGNLIFCKSIFFFLL